MKTNIFERFSNNNTESEFKSIVQSEQVSTEQETEGNVFEKAILKQNEKEKNSYGLFDTIKDVGEQFISKGISGLGGAYGNILSAFGLQLDENAELPPQALYDVQSKVVEKMNAGESPTYGELLLLSDYDPTGGFSRLPSSEDINSGIEKVTGIGEGKTPSGRIAGQGAKFLGEAAALGAGGKLLATQGVAGVTGQSIREAGLGEIPASIAEVGLSIAPSVISKKLIPSGKSAKDTVEAGRKIGLTESQITPLIQGEKKLATLSKVGKKGSRTKKLFAEIKEKLGDSYSNIKNSPEASTKIARPEQISLRNKFGSIRNELSKTLAPSPDKEAALNYIEKSLETLRDVDVTPEYLVNFWQDINKSVKWNSITGGKKALTELKKPISEILKKTSPKLAEDFEMTNNLYSKYANISKKLKPDIIDSILNKAEIVGTPVAVLSFVTGNPSALVGLGTESAIRILSTEMLVNPYFQNTAKKLVTNLNQGSVKAITTSMNQVKDFMKRKHPNEDWSFLTENIQDIED